MQPYKLIACDLDGTLLDDSMSVSEENLAAISQIAARGVEFVPCTGRAFSEIPEPLRNHPHVRWIIESNGAVIRDLRTGEQIRMCMSREQIRRVLDQFSPEESFFVIHKDGETFVDAQAQTQENYAYNRVTTAYQGVIKLYAGLMEDFRARVYDMDGLEVMCVCSHSARAIDNCRRVLEESGEYIVATMNETTLEIFSGEAGKGNALRRLAEKLGMETSEVIGIGDSGNDLTMFEVAGLGLAVSGAAQTLRGAADRIICSNEEHVAQYVLEQYL